MPVEMGAEHLSTTPIFKHLCTAQIALPLFFPFSTKEKKLQNHRKATMHHDCGDNLAFELLCRVIFLLTLLLKDQERFLDAFALLCLHENREDHQV